MVAREIVIEVISPNFTQRIPIHAEEDNEVNVVKKVLEKAGVQDCTIIYPYQAFFDVVGVEVNSDEAAEAIASAAEEVATWGDVNDTIQ